MENRKKEYKMENNELKKACFKKCASYYFNDIINSEDLFLDCTLIDEKPHENSLIFDILYKNWSDWKPLRIRFIKTGRIIIIYNGTWYDFLITWFDIRKYHAICEKNNVFYKYKKQ